MLKKHIMTGVLVWIPIWVTIAVMRFALSMLSQVGAWIPDIYKPCHVLGWCAPGLDLLFILFMIWVTGVLAGNVLGKWFIQMTERVLERIPLVRSVYHGVKQAMSVIFSQSKEQKFSRVVLVEYPRKGVWSMAFVTNEGLEQSHEVSGTETLTVFIPTTPNPTSGYIIMVPEHEAHPIDLSVDVALRYVISLGTVLPHHKPTGEK